MAPGFEGSCCGFTGLLRLRAAYAGPLSAPGSRRRYTDGWAGGRFLALLFPRHLVRSSAILASGHERGVPAMWSGIDPELWKQLSNVRTMVSLRYQVPTKEWPLVFVEEHDELLVVREWPDGTASRTRRRSFRARYEKDSDRQSRGATSFRRPRPFLAADREPLHEACSQDQSLYLKLSSPRSSCSYVQRCSARASVEVSAAGDTSRTSPPQPR